MSRTVQVNRTASRTYRAAACGWLAALGGASLILTTGANRFVGALLRAQASPLAWLAEACIPSCLACLAAWLAIRPSDPFILRARPAEWRPSVRLGCAWLACWLAGSAVGAVFAGHWLRAGATHDAPTIVAFLLAAPLGEELLFRGAIFELSERAFGHGGWAPVIVSTVFFSLHHLQLHQFQPTPAALAQLAFTVPMGLVFGRIRQLTSSVSPAFVVHVLTNLPGVVGS